MVLKLAFKAAMSATHQQLALYVKMAIILETIFAIIAILDVLNAHGQMHAQNVSLLIYQFLDIAVLWVAVLVIGINVLDVIKVCSITESAVLLAQQTVFHVLMVNAFLDAQILVKLAPAQLFAHLVNLDTISQIGLAQHADLNA
jgi:hypothetical protein